MSSVVRELFPPTSSESNTMLAVDILTKKLQDQSLEESNQNVSKIKFIRPGEGFKLSKNAEAKLAAGKKVYTLQLKSDGQRTPSSDQMNANQYSTEPYDNERTFPQCVCDKSPNANVDPPSKRHCRSLTVPSDKSPPDRWKPQESHVWKPIAVINNSSGGQQNLKSTFPREVTYNCESLTNHSGFVSLAPRNIHFEPGGDGSRIFHIPPDIFTPPESPVPRPSSASTCTGRHDMFSPLNAPWLDQSHQRYHAFDNRSLSYEDQISCSTTAGSTPSVSAYVNSNHSSPHRHRIPRCRSQPSVLHDRKYGVKRRRDYDHRPALNFNKMTETAYQRQTGSQPVATPGNKEKRMSRFHEELESVMSLMPIASSPLDNDVPLKRAMESRTSPITEMEQGRADSAEFLDADPNDFLEDGPVSVIQESDEMEEIFPLQDDLDLEQIETN